MKIYLTPLFLLLLMACEPERKAEADQVINELKDKFAPDSRVALFDIKAVSVDGNLILKGESNLPEAVDALRETLTAEGFSFADSIQLLPDTALAGKHYGIVQLSVANLRSAPKHAAELSTQATLGTPLKVLRKKRGWYLVQTPDKYIAWIDSGGLITLNKEDFNNWKAAKKLIYLKPFGFSYKKPTADAQTVSDLVSGNILELSGEDQKFYQVKYPDQTLAYVAKKDMQPYDEWLEAINISGSALVGTSKKLMGVPYLWGGTSFKGVDCSGFTKTVFFLNGMVIPRDASQQVHTGQQIDTAKMFDKLLPGDLLFFGRPATSSAPEKVVHVGMWIGNNEFIHSAGSVHISSMDSTAENFDAYNYRRYLRTKRLLHEQDENLIHLANSMIFSGASEVAE